MPRCTRKNCVFNSEGFGHIDCKVHSSEYYTGTCMDFVEKKYYRQKKDVNWINTPKGTIWVTDSKYYIQPEDESLRETPLGVELSLLDDEDIALFEEIPTVHT